MKSSSKKPVSISKSFRLIDFYICDESRNEKSSDSSTESSDSDESSAAAAANTDESQLMIQMFGINERGETCSLFVNDYRPFFFIKIGENWTQITVNTFLQDLKNKLPKYYHTSILSAKIVEYNKLYGFSGGKMDKFMEITFLNMNVFNRVKNFWFSYDNSNAERERRMRPYIFKGTSLELYESNIPPLLRYFHLNNISPSGWVMVPINKVSIPTRKTTTCNYEYNCSFKHIKPLPEKETRVPYKICSFDIEASSSHGDFPIPIKTYKRLATNVIDVFDKQFKSQELDIVQSSGLFEKIIMAAFGFDHFNNIDLVYPKKQPSKKEIKDKIKLILKTPVDAAFSLGEQGSRELLTIDSLFEKMKEDLAAAATSNDDDDDDGGGQQESAVAIYKKKSEKKTEKTKDDKTILTILVSTDYSRDEKIKWTNEIMTCLFPRLEGDKTTFIGSTFMRYGESEPYLNHCVVLGSCDPIDNTTIETVDTERELLLKWTELIQEENPDIIIGYNIFGFDYEFLFRRSQETNCTQEFLKLSRKINDVCAKHDKNGEITSIENTKIQLASGEYDLRYFKMAGRLQIDMYSYFRRDFNLPSYKLDDVSGQFIADDIKKIENEEHLEYGPITKLFSRNLTGLKKDDFIHIEISGFTADYYQDGKKFRVLDIHRNIEDFNIILIEGIHPLGQFKSLKWGMAKDDVTPQDIFRLSAGSASDRAIVAKYCIQDCNLVHHLMNKIDVITGYVEMSRICSVPISFLIFRGQGIKLTSYVAKKCREKQTLMPDLEKSNDNGGYEGAIVLPPKCAMYMDNPVACNDYSSLYPSSMISENLSHDSKVWTKEYDLEGNLIKETGEKDKRGNFVYDNLPGYKYIDIEFDSFRYVRKTPKGAAEKVKSGKMICRWAQFPDNKKGIMPSILEELLKARSDTRKMIKTEKDPFMQNILDKRQLGYKVTANSLYGQCGSKTSTFYEKDVAASTTATGRKMIIYAKRIIEEVYGDSTFETSKFGTVLTKAEYVYGDSVANYTPVYIRINGEICVCTIEELAEKYGQSGWVKCLEPGRQEKEVCHLADVETWTEQGWTKLHRVIRHILAPNKKMMRIMTHTGLVDVTDDHSLILANGAEISPKNVEIGTELMHHSIDFQQKINTDGFYSCAFTNQIDAAKHMMNIWSNGYNKTSIDLLHNKYIILAEDTNPVFSPNAIKKIEKIDDYTGYVYDLTTENHHFAAGIGNMIVHNTDSVFFTFNLEDPITKQKIVGKDALEITIEIAQHSAKLCTEWLKPPMELSYEKTLMPFILLSKKRYVGMLFEEDPNKGKLKYMGLSLKRRDSCDYLKDVYGGILNILMKENNIKSAVEFLERALNDLVEGKVPMDKLAITKALRSDYKNPNQIAHNVLAERIGNRDPGNKPKPGDRIKFLYIVNPEKKALLGEKIETPEYILEKKVQIDYMYYITNQLMKPLQQLFGLALEQLWELGKKKGAIKEYQKDMIKMKKEYDDMEIFMKKKEKYCSEKVKILLFDKFLNRIYNEKNKIQTLESCFVRSKK